MERVSKDYDLVFVTGDAELVRDFLGSGDHRSAIQRGLVHYLPSAREAWVESLASPEVKPLTPHLVAFVEPVRVHVEGPYSAEDVAECAAASMHEYLRRTEPVLVDYPETVQFLWDER